MNSAVSGTFSSYRLVSRLGMGGMAEVDLVCSDDYSKLLVLKRVRSDLTDEERQELLQMFRDETRLALRLNHPNIVQAFEAGSHDTRPYILMEFLEGQTLLRTQQRARMLGEGFSTELSIFVLCQVLDALAYAHQLTDYDGRSLHIVHRDVSPQNVFITYSGHTKLVDFGVAKTLSSTKTCAGMVKGNVAYMAPEQVQPGAAIDRRADLFGVGVLLWETIAAQPMLAGRTVYDSLTRLVKGDIPSIRSAAPDVDPELERIVSRALAFEPAARYPDAESFRAELAAYLGVRGAAGTHDVGRALTGLFARERAELDRLIRVAMRDSTLEEIRLAGDGTRQLPLDAGMTQEGADALYEVPDSALLELVEEDRALPPALARAQPRRRLRRMAAFGLSLVGALVLLLGMVRTRRVPETPGAPKLASASAVQVIALPAPQAPPAVRPVVGEREPASLEASAPPLQPRAAEPSPALRREPDQAPRRFSSKAGAERYVELPAPRLQATVPELDRSEPWPEPAVQRRARDPSPPQSAGRETAAAAAERPARD